jgi:hypothetical protein
VLKTPIPVQNPAKRDDLSVRPLAVAIWRTRWLLVAVGIAGVVGLLWLVVVAAPPWFVDDESLEGLKAQNDVRTTLLQGLAGVVLLLGAYFTYRQLRTAREGQITERYTRAIDQLGHTELDVRLGGIYALERIARDSPPDRRTIGEVLCAFVRSHVPWPPSLAGQYVATAPIDQMPDLQVRAPDVQASLTVLGRGGFDSIDLRGADLRRADLLGAHMQGAEFDDANLAGANLSGAHLDHAWFFDANLAGANLSGANLKDAIFTGAHLKDAWLHLANLEGAILYRAHLQGADLHDANLEGSESNEETSWPAGFNWRAVGVILVSRVHQSSLRQRR